MAPIITNFHHPLFQLTLANPGSPGKRPLKRTEREMNMKYITYGRGQEKTHNKTMKQTEKFISTFWLGLCGDNLLIMIRLPHRSASSQSLGKH